MQPRNAQSSIGGADAPKGSNRVVLCSRCCYQCCCKFRPFLLQPNVFQHNDSEAHRRELIDPNDATSGLRASLRHVASMFPATISLEILPPCPLIERHFWLTSGLRLAFYPLIENGFSLGLHLTWIDINRPLPSLSQPLHFRLRRVAGSLDCHNARFIRFFSLVSCNLMDNAGLWSTCLNGHR